jgi:hypothetical protein
MVVCPIVDRWVTSTHHSPTNQPKDTMTQTTYSITPVVDGEPMDDYLSNNELSYQVLTQLVVQFMKTNNLTDKDYVMGNLSNFLQVSEEM